MVGRAISNEKRAGKVVSTPHRISTQIMLSEVVSSGVRLDAAAFGIESRKAVDSLKSSGLPLVALYGKDGFCDEAHNAFRFRRIYVEASHGIPFLSSSDIISMRPEIHRFLSKKVSKDLERLMVRKWDVMISCSGTIGNVALAGDTFIGHALSQDAIRLRSDTVEKSGYVCAFLRSRFGRPQLTGASYGSVIVHIEPSHLERILIPQLHPLRMSEIGGRMRDACDLRDEANRLLAEADVTLHRRLGLPLLSELKSSKKTFQTVKASDLQQRLEASFHDPGAYAALHSLTSGKTEITTLSDPRTSLIIPRRL